MPTQQGTEATWPGTLRKESPTGPWEAKLVDLGVGGPNST